MFVIGTCAQPGTNADRPPFVVAKPAPEYSSEAKLAKLEGSVLLSVVVGADGKPSDIQVVRPLGLGLDEKAIDNVRSWTFRPGTKNGLPVAARVTEEVFFRPKRELWDWHLVRATFQLPNDAARPLLIKTKFPATVDVEENAAVIVGLDVAPNGAPANLRVVRSSDSRWDGEVLATIRDGWRFRAGTVDGKPVAVPAVFVFVRGSHSPIPLPRPAP